MTKYLNIKEWKVWAALLLMAVVLGTSVPIPANASATLGKNSLTCGLIDENGSVTLFTGDNQYVVNKNVAKLKCKLKDYVRSTTGEITYNFGNYGVPCGL